MKCCHWKLPVELFVAICVVTCGAGCQQQATLEWAPHQRAAALDGKLQQQIQELLVNYTGTPQQPKRLDGRPMDAARLQRGQTVYNARCSQCHGESGDGAGPVAKYMQPLPRDYRLGIFKFTSTSIGDKPRRSDLLRTLRRGIPGTSMPSFAFLPEDDLQDVVDYVILLSQRGELEKRLLDDAEDAGEIDPAVVPEHAQSIVEQWQAADRQIVMPISSMPEFTPESVAAGREVFLTMGCSKCHGPDGRGGSVGKVDVGKDDWGHVAAAADLTSGMFRGGGRPIDIYRRIYAGIYGTPMPSFSGALEKEPDKVWQLVHYIKHLGDERRESLPTLEAMWKREPTNNPAAKQEPPLIENPPEPTDGR